MTRPHRRSRFTWRSAAVAGIGLLVLGLWFLWIGPRALGGPATYSIVSGQSMEPTYEPGDYLIALARDSYSVGDIIMFEVQGGIVVHRVVGGSAEAGFMTQGDNNPGIDPWRPKFDAILGEVWLHVPILGRLIAVVRGPLGIGVMAGLLTTLAILDLTSPRGRHRKTSVWQGQRTHQTGKRPGMAGVTLGQESGVEAGGST